MNKKFLILIMLVVGSASSFGRSELCNYLQSRLRYAVRNLDDAYQYNDPVAIAQWSYAANGYAIGLASEGCL